MSATWAESFIADKPLGLKDLFNSAININSFLLSDDAINEADVDLISPDINIPEIHVTKIETVNANGDIFDMSKIPLLTISKLKSEKSINTKTLVFENMHVSLNTKTAILSVENADFSQAQSVTMEKIKGNGIESFISRFFIWNSKAIQYRDGYKAVLYNGILYGNDATNSSLIETDARTKSLFGFDTLQYPIELREKETLANNDKIRFSIENGKFIIYVKGFVEGLPPDDLILYDQNDNSLKANIESVEDGSRNGVRFLSRNVSLHELAI